MGDREGAYMSEDDESSEGGCCTGFVWGNLDSHRRLDEEDRSRYPEELQPNIEDENVVGELSSSILTAAPSAAEPVVALPGAVSALVPPGVVYHSAPPIARYGRVKDDDDSEDFDADDDVDASRQRREQHHQAKDPGALLAELRAHLPAPALSESAASQPDNFTLPVLRREEDGTEVLKFSEMYYLRGTELFTGEPRSKKVVHFACDKEATTAFVTCDEDRFMLDDGDEEATFIAGTGIVVDELDVAAVRFRDQFSIGDIHHKGFTGPNLGVRIEDSVFSLIEQLPWESDIVWQDDASVDSVASTSISPVVAPPAPPALSSPKSERVAFMDVDILQAEMNAVASPTASTASLPELRAPVSLLIGKPRKALRASVNTGPIVSIPVPTTWSLLEVPAELASHVEVRLPSLPPLTSLNTEFADMAWIDTIVWDVGDNSSRGSLFSSLILDANDPHMIFDSAESCADQLRPHDDADAHIRFNLSHDQSTLYVKAGVEERAIVGRAAVQHAMFSQELARPIYKSHWTEEDLVFFHRPRAHLESAYITARASSRQPVLVADVPGARKFVPKKESELSGRDGRIILAEYIEEYPPLIANVGMASELTTFYRQKDMNDQTHPVVADGMLRILRPEKDDESPFIADVRQGSQLTSIRNNMFTAPMLPHSVSPTDFLLTRSTKRANWSLREIPALYTVGQIQPRSVVITPGSRDDNKALKDMLSVFVFRLFRACPKLLIGDVFDEFPSQSETAIRGKLKEVADFQRGGHESGCWVLNPERAQLPSDSALREMVTPEIICEYASMRAGLNRLESLGMKLFAWTPQLSAVIAKLRPGPLKRQLEYVEQELHLTPWSLTNNYLNAVQGRCLLKLQGPGNPLGKGAGFSYIKAPHRFEPDPTAPKIAPAKALTGTDKDLRKLNMQELFNALKTFMIPEMQIKDMPRWDRVGLLRKLSSDAHLNGDKNTQFSRFARQQRNTVLVQQLRFQKEAQKIFDKQCEVLRNPVPPHLDDRSSEDEADELAADLEDMLEERMGKGNGLSSDLQQDQAEQAEYESFMKEKSMRERSAQLEGQRAIIAEASPASSPAPIPSIPGKKATIKRRSLQRREVVHDQSGVEHERVSIITDPIWIDAFIADQVDGGTRLKALEDALAVSQANGAPVVAPIATKPGELAKSRNIRTKRPALKSGSRQKGMPGAGGSRHLKRLKDSVRAGKSRPSRMPRNRAPRPPVIGPNGKPMIMCSSCGIYGHTKSNRKCKNHPDNFVLKLTNEESKVTLSLAKVKTPRRGGERDGSLKTTLPTVATVAGEMKPPRPTAFLATAAKKKRPRDSLSRIVPNVSCSDGDERGPKRRASFRRRGDPQITLNSFFMTALEATNGVIGVNTFSKLVTDDIAPNYSTIVANPMYIDLMKKKVRDCVYLSCADFKADLDLIRSNSALYNGPENLLTVHANIVVDAAKRDLQANLSQINETERHLTEYHLLKALWRRLTSVLDTLWASADSILFRFNVRKSDFPDYHSKVRNPVSLTSIRERLERSEYDSLVSFMSDIDLLVSNAQTYNGVSSPVADQAVRLRQIALDRLQEQPTQ